MLLNKIKNNKILCIICLISILIFCLCYNNLIKKYKNYNKNYNEDYKNYNEDNINYNEDNINNTDIYVLYIPKREKYIRDIMKKLKLKPEFIKGPDKNKLDLEKMIENNEVTKKYGIEKNRGRIACHLGHLNILNKFLKTNKKYALIFEDDIKNDDYNRNNTKIKNLINNIPPDAEIVYFGYCFENCSNQYKYNKYFNYSLKPKCRHCYLVSRKGANIIISNTKYITDSGDIRYAKLIRENKLKSYSVNTNYLLIQQNREDLGTELGNNQKLVSC